MNINDVYLPGLGYLNKCSKCGKTRDPYEMTNLSGWCMDCIKKWKEEDSKNE
jgi:hypothetical protein